MRQSTQKICILTHACPACGAINLIVALQGHFVVWQTSYRYNNVLSEKTSQAPPQERFWSFFGAFVMCRTAYLSELAFQCRTSWNAQKHDLVHEFLLCSGVNPALKVNLLLCPAQVCLEVAIDYIWEGKIKFQWGIYKHWKPSFIQGNCRHKNYILITIVCLISSGIIMLSQLPITSIQIR